MRASAATRLAVMILALLALAQSAAWAQVTPPKPPTQPAQAAPPAGAERSTLFGLNADGEVVVGSRFYLIRPSDSDSAKYEEYRDLPPGPYLDTLRLRVRSPDEAYFLEFGGSKWGHDDAEVGLGVGRLGLWQFGFEYDQTPHVHSTTARTLAAEVDRGRWVLPVPRPNLNLHNSAPRVEDDIAQRWDTVRFGFQLTPTPDLTLRADYTRISKNGDKPGSIPFGSPGGNFYEILSPVEQTVQDFRLKFSLVREAWQIQGGYAFSMFQQNQRVYEASNPCFGLGAAVDTGGCAGDSAGAQTGQMSLDPSNQAHTFGLSGGVNLPMRTRLTASATHSIRLQDDSFLPHTINPALAANPALALPQKSLDGYVGTTLVNLQATTRPWTPLTLTARYRLYDHNDERDSIDFPGHVVNDRTLVVEERRAGRWSHTRQNADLDARYRFIEPLTGFVGAGWERWDRNSHREVKESDEYFGRVGLDLRPADWISSRLVYKPAFRRIGHYETFAHLGHTVVEEVDPDTATQFQSPLLRKYDEADRNRHAFTADLSLHPTETVTTTFTADYRIDDYNNSSLGLQDAQSWSVGVDASWRPAPRFGIFGGYVYEQIFNKQRSRSRPVVGGVTLDFDDYDWITKHTDTVHTAHLGADVVIIPGTLDWTGRWTFSYALGEQDTRNPGPVVSGPTSNQTTASAKRVPAFQDTFLRLDTWLRWYFAKSWTMSVGYAWEQFWQNDWRTDGLVQFNPSAGSSIWLGSDNHDYAAHLIAVTLGYRFK